MQVNVENISPVLVEFSIEIDAERVTSEYNKAIRQVAKQSKIKGFRPGKAPKNIVQRVCGPRVEADVMQKLIDDTLPKAAQEKELQTVSQPQVVPSRVKSGQTFSYTAKVEVLPKIETVTYEGLEAKKPKVDVTDEQVQTELDQVRRANSTVEAPSEPRPAKDGDILTVDLKATVDGEEIEDAGTEGFPIEIGSGQVFKEIEEALVGASIDETKVADVPMPEGHPHPKLAGKTAQFHVTVKELKERILPAADDELAKDLGEFDTLEALKENLKETIGKRQESDAENLLAERLVTALVEANPIPLPPSLVAQQMQISEREILMRAQMQGQTVSGVGEELREKIKSDSETKVRAGLVMAEIAKKESIQIGADQLEEGLKELAEQTGKNVARLRAEYSEPRKREMLVGMILENKVLDLIEEKAKISEE
ncbi:MAG: trigger factor [Polyangiaceae bacterium]|nr:trigger factor [Polyangiaceae bacterium]